MMIQAYLERPGALTFRELPLPEPGPGELLIRIHTALSCGTDLKTYRRGHAVLPVPGPLGHEAAGTVVAVGDGVTKFSEGDAVMWAPTAPCHTCTACARGLYNHCETLFKGIAMGAYADFILLPPHIVSQHVFHKPEHLPFAEAALMEPLACILRGWRRMGALGGETASLGAAAGSGDLERGITGAGRGDTDSGLTAAGGHDTDSGLTAAGRGGIDSVLIIGVGAIGLLHVAVAKALGCPQITAVGGRASGLELAQELGAHRVVRGHVPAVAEELRAAGLADPDVVIECTGNATVWAAAPALTRVGGTALLFGGLTGQSEVSFTAKRIHYDEVTLLGSFHYTPADVKDAYRLLADGELSLGGLITNERPLADLPFVFEQLERGEEVKVALRP